MNTLAEGPWDFRRTAFVEIWSRLMQWRYVRVLAFAWLVLGYSRGWSVAVEPFGPLVAIITGCLALAALLDAGLAGWSIVKARRRASALEAGVKDQ